MNKLRMCLIWLLTRLLKKYCILHTVGVLEPYYDYRWSRWCFDDKNTGLVAEGFSEGIGIMIDHLVRDFVNPRQGGWQLQFSSIAFPGYQLALKRGRLDNGGVWYTSYELDVSGWLCSALYRYFAVEPETIYIRITPKGVV